jgi:hypothetical protein
MKNKKNPSVFVEGDIVKCIKQTTTGPSIMPSEEEYTIARINICGGNTMNLEEFPSRGYVYQDEFELAPQTVERLEAKIVRLQAAYDKEEAFISNKITYLKLTGNEIFHPNEFKIWSVLQELNATTDDVTKAKMIAQIIEG